MSSPDESPNIEQSEDSKSHQYHSDDQSASVVNPADSESDANQRKDLTAGQGNCEMLGSELEPAVSHNSPSHASVSAPDSLVTDLSSVGDIPEMSQEEDKTSHCIKTTFPCSETQLLGSSEDADEAESGLIVKHQKCDSEETSDVNSSETSGANITDYQQESNNVIETVIPSLTSTSQVSTATSSNGTETVTSISTPHVSTATSSNVTETVASTSHVSTATSSNVTETVPSTSTSTSHVSTATDMTDNNMDEDVPESLVTSENISEETINMDKIPCADKQEDNSEPMETKEEYVPSVVYNVSKPPVHITGAWTEFSQSHNYLKGSKWSPDGSCLLTCSNDCSLRLFNLPEPLLSGQTENLDEMVSVLKIQESETVYDYCWYPSMSSADPPSCCLVTTSANTPVHLWDAFTGELRCSYRAYNQVDEVAPAHSVSFSPDGSKLYCGFNKMIRIFDVNRPGRQFKERKTFVKEGQAGIISSIVSSPEDPRLYAAGSYSRSIALYYEPAAEMVCMFQGHQGGITHILFSPDGTKLLSGGRKDPEILCWDLRNPGRILFTAQRQVETNQRIYFDIDLSGHYLISGNHDGTVTVWDMTQPSSAVQENSDPVLEHVLKYQTHADTVNGVSFHPSMPLIATSSGQRHFQCLDDSDDETMETTDKIDNSVRLWYV